jgi:hypothetical protein
MSVELYPPIGKCIYCGADRYATDSRRFLAPEHIVPFALNGNLVLPQASCRKCERITGRTETLVLKGALLGCRTYLGLQTRSPKERPKALPLFDTTTKPERKVMVEIEDYPISLMLSRLTEPGVGSSGKRRMGQNGIWLHFFKQPNENLLRSKYKLSEFAMSSLDTHSLVRMLAKIAHSFTVAERAAGRIEDFKPFLLPTILDEKVPHQDMLRFVGGASDLPPSPDALHEVVLEQLTNRLLSVRIRLFAQYGAPVYRVVVGELCR